MWSKLANDTGKKMPTATENNDVTQSDINSGGGSTPRPQRKTIDASTPVLVSLPSKRVTERQQAMEEKRKKDENELAMKENRIALEKEAAKDKRQEAANRIREAEQDDATGGEKEAHLPSSALGSGRRRGRNATEVDDEEKERANKQQGVGSPMRSNSTTPRRDLSESPLRVEAIDMSIEGNGGTTAEGNKVTQTSEIGWLGKLQLMWVGLVRGQLLPHPERGTASIAAQGQFLSHPDRGAVSIPIQATDLV